jgi:hypothetical protein
LASFATYNDRVKGAVELFLRVLGRASQKKPDVIVLVMPLELLALLGDEQGEDPDSGAVMVLSYRESKYKRRGKFNFHDMLKARALGTGGPNPIIATFNS